MAHPGLTRFFDPRRFVRAPDEWPLATAEDELRRTDRMIEFDDAIWVRVLFADGATLPVDAGPRD